MIVSWLLIFLDGMKQSSNNKTAFGALKIQHWLGSLWWRVRGQQLRQEIPSPHKKCHVCQPCPWFLLPCFSTTRQFHHHKSGSWILTDDETRHWNDVSAFQPFSSHFPAILAISFTFSKAVSSNPAMTWAEPRLQQCLSVSVRLSLARWFLFWVWLSLSHECTEHDGFPCDFMGWIPSIIIYHYLVGGLEHDFYFPYIGT